ncbi:MAG: 6-phospho-beta-glucosidase [Firmicutes bacterium]|jgi:6-phospho-beta-glucosidase|nr:6-phospho-beta-glucosidase [Bacillota bacterium]MDH7494716.1 6-phospho-beta-glucosidase [Bacillota bacterium]
MKLTILGGAGVRTPAFVQGILKASSDLGVDEVHLTDSDADKLHLIGFIVREMVARAGDPFRLNLSTDAREALVDADFVVSALRVGGLEGRAIDEAVALRHGVIGQETTGPGGICMGLRTIPVMLDYAKLIAELAPKAWLINFTNPSGMITEAILSHGGMNRVVGVCDGPSSMVRRIAAALGVNESRAYFDYFGLNHLGWLRGVYVDGEDVLGPMLSRLDEPGVRERLGTLHEISIFGAEFVRELGAIPNEYLYYYYYNREALEHIRRARERRGQFLLRTTRELLGRLRAAVAKGDAALALREYTEYMDTRHRMYMRTETGTDQPDEEAAVQEVTSAETRAEIPRESEQDRAHDDTDGDGGYDRIALGVMKAVALNSNRVMILNTRNAGSIKGLDDDVVAEVPCVVSADGVRPIAVGSIPNECLGLMQIVKECEKLTIEAAVTGSYNAAWKALALHPLVPSVAAAREILDDYLSAHGRSLSHIRRQGSKRQGSGGR